ncbi:Hypothetical predicted protein [Cloeon dipterum]|uniref:Palmitoyltransferase n=1 Tax=Cloeon dipterum TaxID=197152 RepID=A0A8S1DS31_9INSE|nr:Hypothetical predicted protein [Cloeon dipterum]
MRLYLTTKLQNSLEVRLLHPGANTVDILITYVAAIRALRLLDPSGVLLDTVTTPIRQYLRQREDTVRCVVTNLTEEGPSELAEELAKGNALDEAVDSDDDMEDWTNWQPPPVDADPTDSGQSKRSSDIISMLVSVYGSKELFVNEYRILLADRLLSQFNCNTDKEIRYLELLKRRFGDSQLHYCEVMLKDVQDSKRMNSHLHSCPDVTMCSKDFPCTAIILSAQFWPPFKEENLEVPPIVKEHLDDYTKAFEALKGNRTLSWKPHLGYVNLDIELKDRTLNLTVSPIHATIIWHFQEKPQWTIEDLSQVMQISGTLLRRKISFWQSQGILREQSPDVFVLMEEGAARAGSTGRSADHVACEDEEMESALASAHEQREGELQVFWSYIVAVLVDPSIRGRMLEVPNPPDRWHLCAVCESFVPPRSWHCEDCGTCVLKRDHHCLFTACCIGHHNHRYFLVFLTHLFIATSYATYFNGSFVWRSWESFSCSINQFYLTLYAINIAGIVFAGALLGYHLMMMYKGQVTYESANNVRIYDYGWKQNLKEILGERWYLTWIFPTLESKLPHNGIVWHTREQWMAEAQKHR